MMDTGYEISNDGMRIDADAVHAYLSRSYWSPGVSRETVSKAIAHSLCVGAFHRGEQVGFARAVTDQATFAWIADVYVLEPHRGRGLARWMMRELLSQPGMRGLRRTMLATLDAHGLYARYGFAPVDRPHEILVRQHLAGVRSAAITASPAMPDAGFRRDAIAPARADVPERGAP